MPITIRRGTAADALQIAAFQEAMALETEGRTLDHATILAGVHGLLARPAHGFYLVAERDDQIAGSLMVTPEWSDWRGGFFWWVQSVYIDAAHRRAGVYRALYEQVHTDALDEGSVIGVRLYVERENEAARAVYRRLGMTETPYRLYESPVESSSS
jgi:GNAT superfamily N-acetyltransferase